jgi:hypothetical protein
MMVGPAVNIWFAIGALFFPVLVWPDWARGYLGDVPSFTRARDKACLLIHTVVLRHHAVVVYPRLCCVIMTSLVTPSTHYRS